jgi:hypothetical protein
MGAISSTACGCGVHSSQNASSQRSGTHGKKLEKDLTDFLQGLGVSQQEQTAIQSEIKDALQANGKANGRPDFSKLKDSIKSVLDKHGIDGSKFTQSLPAPPQGAGANEGTDRDSLSFSSSIDPSGNASASRTSSGAPPNGIPSGGPPPGGRPQGPPPGGGSQGSSSTEETSESSDALTLQELIDQLNAAAAEKKAAAAKEANSSASGPGATETRTLAETVGNVSPSRFDPYSSILSIRPSASLIDVLA